MTKTLDKRFYIFDQPKQPSASFWAPNMGVRAISLGFFCCFRRGNVDWIIAVLLYSWAIMPIEQRSPSANQAV